MKFTRKVQYFRIALLLVVAPGIAIGQINEYLNHTPVWQVNHQCAVPQPCIQYEDYNYYVSGDTIFNGLTYKKIFRQGTGSYSWFGPPPVPAPCTGTYSYINTVSEHFVRSVNKQMFIRVYGDTSEYLLYDFDLQIGDTLPLTYNNFEPLIIVTSIDSFSTPYGYRKRFALAGNTWASELLEGIGHNRGFLEPVHTPFECGFTLNCFSLNDTAYYPAPGPSCMLILGAGELPESPKGNITPNPFSDYTTISWNAAVKNGEIKIYDIRGKVVKTISGISGESLKFYSEKLMSGIYFFEMRAADTNVYFNGKLLIQK